MIYRLIQKILFLINPETVHKLTLGSLFYLHLLRISKCFTKVKAPKKVLGLTFENSVGLSAGFDKNGEYIDALADLGFGFIEVGTITPKPQAGNPKPRIFRIKKAEAVINRLGFNNKGVDYLVEKLKQTKYKGILGINIGKNKTTPNENAIDDYLYCFKRVVEFASYITINISSPNTPELRNLQHGDLLKNLLRTLKQEQLAQKRYVPLLVKISPDLTPDELKSTAEIILAEKMDGVIATNTTLSRAGVEGLANANETGGLSGKPLMKSSTAIITQLKQLLGNQIPIIGCGGIMTAADAKEKLDAGASLVQVYTGLIYRGPSLIKQIALLNRDGLR